MTCKTCAFWGELKQTYPPTIHRCCMHPKIGNCDDADGFNDNADYEYGVSSGPDFGCIHHEEKK